MRQRAIEASLSLSQANPPVEAAFQIVDILPLSIDCIMLLSFRPLYEVS